MDVAIIGVNHHTAPVEMRERLAFDPGALNEPLRRLLGARPVSEALILSTCNRVEIALAADAPQEALGSAADFIAAHGSLELGELEEHLYTYLSRDAVRHVFRVASSLDSMVLGEPQILGQVKEAYRRACQAHACGAVLNKFMHRAFRVAKRVRTETRIGDNAVSVSYAAVELARKIFDDLSEKTVLLIGAGEMAELALRHLIDQGVERVIITNRTHENAVSLAAQYRGRAVRYAEFPHYLADADIVLSSTGSSAYIVTAGEVAGIIRRRRNRPMFFIDIAVPRDIDPEVNALGNTYLYNIDDLQKVVDENLDERRAEARKAEDIVEDEVPHPGAHPHAGLTHREDGGDARPRDGARAGPLPGGRCAARDRGVPYREPYQEVSP